MDKTEAAGPSSDLGIAFGRSHEPYFWLLGVASASCQSFFVSRTTALFSFCRCGRESSAPHLHKLQPLKCRLFVRELACSTDAIVHHYEQQYKEKKLTFANNG